MLLRRERKSQNRELSSEKEALSDRSEMLEHNVNAVWRVASGVGCGCRNTVLRTFIMLHAANSRGTSSAYVRASVGSACVDEGRRRWAPTSAAIIAVARKKGGIPYRERPRGRNFLRRSEGSIPAARGSEGASTHSRTWSHHFRTSARLWPSRLRVRQVALFSLALAYF